MGVDSLARFWYRVGWKAPPRTNHPASFLDYTDRMRNEKLACVIAAVLSKQLETHVCVAQGAGYTEWTARGAGFAVLHDGANWSPKQIVAAALKVLPPPPKRKKK